jgi:hypothetical protein
VRAAGWPDTPSPLPDSTTGFTVTSGTRPRKVTFSTSDGADLQRPRLTATDAAIGLFSTPRILDWGTVFTLIKTPSLASGATPVAQRGGATLWLSAHAQASSVGHSVEWVEPGEWLLIASHVTTERVWWDVLGWGNGAGSTVDAPNCAQLRDNGLTLIAVHEPLVVATMQFHSRTFGHEELMNLADSKSIPSDPATVWIPQVSTTFDPAISVLGSLEPAHSWDASSSRARKRAVQIVPTTGNSWRAELKTPSTPVEVLIGGSGDGFAITATAQVAPTTFEPVRSLMNTPFPVDELPVL